MCHIKAMEHTLTQWDKPKFGFEQYFGASIEFHLMHTKIAARVGSQKLKSQNPPGYEPDNYSSVSITIIFQLYLTVLPA